MKITFILNHFLPQKTAGTEVYVWALSKQLKLKGHEITVLIPNFKSVTDQQYIYDGIFVTKYAEPSKVDRALILGERLPDGLSHFINSIKVINPDIVHFHEIGGSNGVGLSHLKAVHALNIPIVTTFHIAGNSCITSNLMYKDIELCNGVINIDKCSTCALHQKGLYGAKLSFVRNAALLLYKIGINSKSWGNSLGTALAHPFLIAELKKRLLLIIQFNSKVVVLTDWYYKLLLQNGITPEKLQLIKQGLPNSILITKRHVISTKLNLVFIGRIEKSKGLHLVLEAMQSIKSNLITLAVYGPVEDDNYFNHCLKKAFNLNVQWHGVIDSQKVVKTLQQYDCVVLPSIICEMSPLVIQESFAAGIPVVASNVYGNAEQILDGKNGWLFKFNDSNDLKNTLQQLIIDPCLIEKAKKDISPVNTFDKVANDYYNLYKSIIEKA